MRLITLVCLVITSVALTANGQTLNSGSTGADGPLVIGPTMTLPPGLNVRIETAGVFIQLREPPNHIFNFTTVTIAEGYKVWFVPNRANTPVYILATGDVKIDGYISVDPTSFSPFGSVVSAKGGPGGFSGGMAP